MLLLSAFPLVGANRNSLYGHIMKGVFALAALFGMGVCLAIYLKTRDSTVNVFVFSTIYWVVTKFRYELDLLISKEEYKGFVKDGQKRTSILD